MLDQHLRLSSFMFYAITCKLFIGFSLSFFLFLLGNPQVFLLLTHQFLLFSGLTFEIQKLVLRKAFCLHLLVELFLLLHEYGSLLSCLLFMFLNHFEMFLKFELCFLFSKCLILSLFHINFQLFFMLLGFVFHLFFQFLLLKFFQMGLPVSFCKLLNLLISLSLKHLSLHHFKHLFLFGQLHLCFFQLLILFLLL